MNNTLRVGIIGTGGISEMHIDGYLQCPNVQIVAGCDIHPQRLQTVCDKYDIPERYDHHKKMLEQSNLDAVSICTDHASHAEIAIDAMEAGKHVMCEKPMAIKSEDAQKMLDVSIRTERLLMLGFVRRFGDDVELIMDLVDQGTFGDFYYAKASYLRRYGFPGGWFGNKEKSGGGPLIDLGVHSIDFCRYLMGNPNPVTVSGSTSYKMGKPSLKDQYVAEVSNLKREDDIFNVEDLATLYVKYDNGATFYMDTCFCMHIDEPSGKIELFGERAGIKVDPDVKVYTTMADRMVDVVPVKQAQFDFRGCFRRELKHFVDCVTEGIPCRNPATDALMITKIIEAGYLSAQTGREVVF